MKRHVLALLLTGPLAQPACAQTEADLRADPRFSSPLACMTAAIYYEARGEPAEGQAAVAAVVLNRMAHPAYPKSVCAVVLQGPGVRPAASSPSPATGRCNASRSRRAGRRRRRSQRRRSPEPGRARPTRRIITALPSPRLGGKPDADRATRQSPLLPLAGKAGDGAGRCQGRAGLFPWGLALPQ
ncbi:cell wall hydrolase [Hankyongella ginsenosidimutans]|nr:cell wall hydrolase [Hankyongella ginsenosidimutans]